MHSMLVPRSPFPSPLLSPLSCPLSLPPYAALGYFRVRATRSFSRSLRRFAILSHRKKKQRLSYCFNGSCVLRASRTAKKNSILPRHIIGFLHNMDKKITSFKLYFICVEFLLEPFSFIFFARVHLNTLIKCNLHCRVINFKIADLQRDVIIVFNNSS